MDSRGTWAFHSVDSWYLNTSLDHYRTHRCHIESTKSEQLSHTLHFHHKHITNPSLIPADKLMAAIADCAHALKGLAHSKRTNNIHQLQTLLQQASICSSTPHPTLHPTHLPLIRNHHFQGWSTHLQGAHSAPSLTTDATQPTSPSPSLPMHQPGIPVHKLLPPPNSAPLPPTTHGPTSHAFHNPRR
eukprot:CCRYP_015425-RA/>CCRYP_015425-RA protein AED:0.47 eAED:0.43 QI:0/0/0/1/0/0/2/0/186